MTTLQAEGRSIELDREGFLLDLNDWSEAVAEALAANEGLMYLLKLFPGSPAKLASKIAGLPKPDNCL